MSEQHLHQIIDQIPPKKTGPSPKKSPGKLPPVPPFHTGETASGSQDKPKGNNPESEHEPKGKTGRPSNSQGPPPVKTDHKTKPKPDHDTEKDENRTRTHWRKAKRECLVYQLFKHGWRWPKSSDGGSAKLSRQELAQIVIEIIGL